jgi:RecJ-like exonuclease
MSAPLKSAERHAPRVLCVSHAKDVDGCVCAALVQRAANARFLLTDYGRINERLRTASDPCDRVYVCDVGIRAAHLDEFRRIRGFAEVIYIDHHPLDDDLSTKLGDMGVTVVHDRRDCAGVLTYNLLREALPREAGLLAAYAAVSDRLEDGPLAMDLLNRLDRDFVLLEAMLLSYALDRASLSLKRRIVNHLARLEHPHQLGDVTRLALEQADRLAHLRTALPSRASRRGNLAYVDAAQDASGTVANLLLDVCDAAIGVGFRSDPRTQVTDLSIRGSANLTLDLGAVTVHLATRLGGFGGGHAKASGARIPTARLMEFIDALSQHGPHG